MTQSTDMLQRYIDAEAAVLKGQRVRFGERDLTMGNLAEIRAGRQEWERKVAAEKRVQAGQSSIGFKTANLS